MSLTTAGNIFVHAADVSGYGPVRALAGLTDEIVESANSVRVNSRTALAVAHRVNEMSEVIASLFRLEFADAESRWPADTGYLQLEALRKFSSMLIQSTGSVLNDVNASLRSLGTKTYLSQLLHQQRDKDQLHRLLETVRDAFQVLMVELKLRTTVMARDLLHRMEALAAGNATELETPDVPTGRLPAAQLPPVPAIHFGRDGETEAVVNAITSKPLGCVAILGGPGIGKTTLAVAVLYQRAIVERFGPRRFFVPCEGLAQSSQSCLMTIADAFGIASSDRKLVRFRLREVLAGSTAPALIVLDNFESAWESPNKREDAEDVLQFLDSIENLALILTLRGSERPGQVRWTRPFLPPLARLSNMAAKQTFYSIADLASSGTNADVDAALDALLRRVDNIPLAVVLMADLAQVESAESLLRRWEALETAILVRGKGEDRLSSLNISIDLSLHSPRMQAVPAAQHLLSILALLPSGVFDTDLIGSWNIPESARALSVLSQNSLVVRRSDQRVHVLAPIRSFLLANYPPSEASAAPVFEHYFDLAQLASQFTQSASQADVSAIACELANIVSVIRYVFTHCEDARRQAAVEAVSSLCSIYEISGIGPAAELLPAAVEIAQELGPSHDDRRADLLVHWASISRSLSMPGDPQTLLEEARSIFERVGDEEGVVRCGLRLVPYLPPADGVLESQRVFDSISPRGPSRLLAECAAMLAYCLGHVGRPRESTAQCKLAIDIMHRSSELQGGPDLDNLIGKCKHRIGRNLALLGDFRGAINSLQEALCVYEATHFAQGIQYTRCLLVELFLFLGQAQKALEFTRLLLAQDAPGAGDLTIHASCLLRAAEAHAQAGDVVAALADLAKVDQLTLAIGPGMDNAAQVEQIQALCIRSNLSVICGDFAEARAYIQVAFTILRGATVSGESRRVLDAEALCIFSLGEVESAAGCLDEAVSLLVLVAIISRKDCNTQECARCLTRLAETVDDEFAERLTEAVLVPLQWMGLGHELAILQLRSATTAKNRGQHDLARKRARNALRYFGEIKGDWRVGMAEEIASAE